MSGEKYDTKLDQTRGNLKKGSGRVIDDKKLETEGFTEKTIIKGKELASDVKESAGGIVGGTKKALHKDN